MKKHLKRIYYILKYKYIIHLIKINILYNMMDLNVYTCENTWVVL